MSKITVTPLKGDKIEIEFKEIKAHVGDFDGYSKYRMASGATIELKESLAEIRKLNENGPKEVAQEVEEEPED